MNVASLLDRLDERDWAPPDQGTLRYALIGLGWWTVDVSIPAIEAGEHCETTVLVSSSTEKADRIATEHDIPTGISYDDFHDGAASDEYDAVYIGTPNSYHLEYAETAAALGKAVLCEKPLEATAERATQLVAACDDADVPLMAAYRMQTDPLTRRARSIIDAGAIGRPIYAYGTNSQQLLEMIPDPDQWRLDPERSGYGTSVMDLGIYSINTARFLLGRDPIRAWSGMHTEHDAFADVPDQWAAFSLELEDDVYLVSTTSQHAHNDAELVITGTEGQLTLEPSFGGKVGITVDRGQQSVSLQDAGIDVTGQMTEEFDYFASKVLRDEPVCADGRDALVDMETIRAIHDAAETGEVVAVQSPE